jgi:peroxiredoxin Q/BCP
MERLQAGDKAPDFTLPSTHGEQSLAAYRGRWVVLYFYPKDDTPGCTTQACDLRDHLPDLDAVVLGVSGDDLASHEAFTRKYQLPFALLSDEGFEVAKRYGAYGEKRNFGKVYEGIIRSSFIIDPEGRIAEAKYNVKAAEHAEWVEARLEALQS